MSFFVVFSSILFTIFATMVLAYISMATMLGPWIAPSIVILSVLLSKLRRTTLAPDSSSRQIALIQTAGSVGGVVANGIGFTLPVLYFLDPSLFNSWLNAPWSFFGLIAGLTISAGSLGIWLARTFAQKLIKTDKLAFPISHMVHKTITTAQAGSAQAKQLIAGLSLTGIFCFLRDGLKIAALQIHSLIPKDIFLFRSVVGKQLQLSFVPMFWAVGFIAGPRIVFPLLVGLISRYVVIAPLNAHSSYLPFSLFPQMAPQDFIFAFCSGLVLSEIIPGLLKYPDLIWSSIKTFSGYNFFAKQKPELQESWYTRVANNIRERLGNTEKDSLLTHLEAGFALLSSIAFLTYFKFPLYVQVLLILFTIIATYQIARLGATIGLMQIGRFATFVMIPIILMFKLSSLQIALLCVFVAICNTVATDLLFDYKIGELMNISFKRIHKYQWFGLIVTTISAGLCFWLLFTNLQLGSAELFAYRGQTRALLIKSLSFNVVVVILGLIYGLLLKRLKISPTMVFGGILMPNGMTFSLVIGSMVRYYLKDSSNYIPFASGAFSAESIWMIISVASKML